MSNLQVSATELDQHAQRLHGVTTELTSCAEAVHEVISVGSFGNMYGVLCSFAGFFMYAMSSGLNGCTDDTVTLSGAIEDGLKRDAASYRSYEDDAAHLSQKIDNWLV